MCGLLPQFRALTFQLTHLFQCLLQVSNMSDGLELLQMKILRRALPDDVHRYGSRTCALRPSAPASRAAGLRLAL
jgi:hypothetical protein